MFFGQEMNLPIDVMIGKPTPEEEPNEDYVFQQRLIKVYAYARAALKRATCQQKATYDKAQPRRKDQFKTPKNVDRKCVNDVTYQIQKSKSCKAKIVHFNRLKKY